MKSSLDIDCIYNEYIAHEKIIQYCTTKKNQIVSSSKRLVYKC